MRRYPRRGSLEAGRAGIYVFFEHVRAHRPSPCAAQEVTASNPEVRDLWRRSCRSGSTHRRRHQMPHAPQAGADDSAGPGPRSGLEPDERAGHVRLLHDGPSPPIPRDSAARHRSCTSGSPASTASPARRRLSVSRGLCLSVVGWLLVGPGSDLSEESACRGSSWPRWTTEPPPSVLPGPPPVVGRVADELPVDDVGEPPFQAAHRFFVALARGSFPLVVGPARRVVSDLGHGHDVQA